VSVQVLNLPIGTIDVSGGFGNWDELGDLVGRPWPRDWSSPLLVAALPFAIQLAGLCYLDTLLTSLVVDRMAGEPTRQNKELMAQGAANGAVALVGGIPGPLAGIAIGAFVLVEMMLLRDLIAMIPQAVFAGILFKVGYDVFDFDTVIAFTGVFLLTNKVLRPHNPIRDLKPDERLVHED